MTGRTNGVATYRNSDFFGLVDGLHFALQYQGNNENAGSGEGTNNGGKRKLARENGDGFGISSYYDLDMGISFGAAYSSSDRTHNQLAAARSSQRYANGDKADAWTVGAKYDANNIYLAAMYAETRNMTFYGNDSFGGIANKTQNFEVVAQYQFDDFNLPLRPSVAYLQSKGKDLYAYSRYGDKDLVKYVDVGMTYYFNKNMSTYVDYKINLLDEDDRFYKNSGIATDDIVALGLGLSVLIPVKARVQRAFLCSRSVEITLFDIAAFRGVPSLFMMRLSSFGLKAAIRCQKDKARYRDSTLKPRTMMMVIPQRRRYT